MERFKLSEVQAQAILDMRLQRLTGMEREKIEAEYKELEEKIAYLKAILGSETRLLEVISEEASRPSRTSMRMTAARASRRPRGTSPFWTSSPTRSR